MLFERNNIEYNYPFFPFGNISSSAVSIEQTFAVSDKTLRTIVVIADGLNKQLSMLSGNIKLLNSFVALKTTYPVIDHQSTTAELSTKRQSLTSSPKNTAEQPMENDLLAGINNIHSLAVSTGSIVKATGKIIPKVSKIGRVLEEIENITATIESVTGGMTGIAEPAGGMAGLTEGIAAAGALAIGGVYLVSSPEKQGGINADTDPNRWREAFEREERENDRMHFMKAHQVTNQKQPDDVMVELDSEALKKDRQQRVEKRVAARQKEMDEIKRNSPVTFADPSAIRNKSDDDEFIKRYIMPVPYKPSANAIFELSIKNIKQRNTLGSSLNGTPLDLAKTSREIAEYSRFFKPHKFIKPAEPNWHIPSEQEWEEHKYIQVGYSAEVAKKPATRKHVSRPPTMQSSQQPDGRTVNIYLNKSMIEHFTVHVQDMKAGITSIKREVETALIEILHSASATN